jgi:hypothetical protein
MLENARKQAKIRSENRLFAPLFLASFGRFCYGSELESWGRWRPSQYQENRGFPDGRANPEKDRKFVSER